MNGHLCTRHAKEKGSESKEQAFTFTLNLQKAFLFIISNFIPLHVSDYKGWTALHHAAFGGYTRTMQIILDTNVKCTDRVDEEGVCVNIICLLSAVTSG